MKLISKEVGSIKTHVDIQTLIVYLFISIPLYLSLFLSLSLYLSLSLSLSLFVSLTLSFFFSLCLSLSQSLASPLSGHASYLLSHLYLMSYFLLYFLYVAGTYCPPGSIYPLACPLGYRGFFTANGTLSVLSSFSSGKQDFVIPNLAPGCCDSFVF